MHTVIHNLRTGRVIEAIKEFRVLYGCGLKKAKDAVEAIRDAFMPPGVFQEPEFLVLSRFHQETDYGVSRVESKDAALELANRIVDHRDDTIVAQVVAKTVVSRTINAAA